MKSWSISLLIVFLFGCKQGYTQRYNTIVITEEDNTMYNRKYKASLSNQQIREDLYFNYIKQGFCFVTIDSINKHAFLVKKGTRFSKIKINGGELGVFRLSEVSKILKNKINVDSNNGFPFTSCHLDSIDFDKGTNTVHAKMSYEKGPYMKINEVIVRGNEMVHEKLVQSVINIYVGQPYRENSIQNVDESIKNCSFLQLMKPSEFLFTKEGVSIYCYVKNKNASSINGVLGVQPNSTTQKIGLTGDVQLKLENILQKGEYFFVNWKNILPQSSSLLCTLKYPYLFKSQFGVHGNLSLAKRDSTFLELNTSVNINYKVNTLFSINSVYKNYQNAVLSNQNNTDFDKNVDVNTNFFGLNATLSTIDYPMNPSKGLNMELEGLSGLRKVNRNENEKNTVFSFKFVFDQYIKLNQRHILKLKCNFQTFISDSIYTNERFRIGGLNSVRGFNEESLFSTTYIVNTFEYRYRLDLSSYVFAFMDYGILQDKTKAFVNNQSSGFGLGFAYNTNIGMFNIVGAYGIDNNQSFDLQEAKIHFGYVAFF